MITVQLYISVNFHIGTHYIQYINVTSDTVPGQIDISCNFLVNSTEVMGYIAIVYSGESNVKYLIVENDDQELVKGNLTNLTCDTYIANLYAIDQTGLPMR